MSKEKITATFEPVNKSEWAEMAAIEIGGQDPFRALEWTNLEEIPFAPYYDRTDRFLPITICQQGLHGQSAGAWQCDNISMVVVKDTEQANKMAIELLNSGASGIMFDLREVAQPDFKILMEGIHTEHCPVSFIIDSAGGSIIQFNDYLRVRKIIPLAPFIFWCEPSDHAIDALIQSDNKSLAIGLQSHSEKGQVESILGCLNEGLSLVDKLTEKGMAIADAFDSIAFSVSIGSEFFLEIAKLRAMRTIWTNVAFHYNQETFLPYMVRLHAYCDNRTRSKYEPGSTMIHETFAVMAAVLGGCNSITVQPLDGNQSMPDRISRNISLILGQEALLDKVIDPVQGSYFIEGATTKLMEAAWKRLIEKK